jgi:hypothetical protein
MTKWLFSMRSSPKPTPVKGTNTRKKKMIDGKVFFMSRPVKSEKSVPETDLSRRRRGKYVSDPGFTGFTLVY